MKRVVIELRTLRYFLAVAEAGTVSAAAESLHVTQPALSRQLRQLERPLGVSLFDRALGRLRLSAAGRALLPSVRDLLADADRLAQTLATGRLDRLTVAAPATTLAEVVSPFIATLEPHDPTPSVFSSDAYEPEAALRTRRRSRHHKWTSERRTRLGCAGDIAGVGLRASHTPVGRTKVCRNWLPRRGTCHQPACDI
jgi:DNA-binding transcriptional LysR family regulator